MPQEPAEEILLVIMVLAVVEMLIMDLPELLLFGIKLPKDKNEIL